MGGSGDDRFRVLAFVAFGFLTGPMLFAIVAFVLQRGQGTWNTGPLVWGWAILAVALTFGARVAWRRMVKPNLPQLGETGPPARADAESLSTGLLVVWALLEGPALFGIVLYFIHGDLIPLAGVALHWLGMLATRPRRSWFGR